MSRPKAINLNDNGTVSIQWMDGSQTLHSMAQLRKECPCATCQMERQKIAKPGPMLRVIDSSVPSVKEAKVVDFTPVGRYALAFVFNDGHGTGIFTYDFLRQTAL